MGYFDYGMNFNDPGCLDWTIALIRIFLNNV